jgi:hypothetical protein
MPLPTWPHVQVSEVFYQMRPAMTSDGSVNKSARSMFRPEADD